MKKQTFVKVLMFALLFLGVMVASASAQGFPTIYMSSEIGGSAQTSFDLNETPYLHLELAETGGQFAFTGSFWNHESGATPEFVGEMNTSTSRWMKLDNWGTVAKTGNWEVAANYFYPGGTTGAQSIGFTVTPEPMAMVLFLVGGLPLGFNLMRKRS